MEQGLEIEAGAGSIIRRQWCKQRRHTRSFRWSQTQYVESTWILLTCFAFFERTDVCSHRRSVLDILEVYSKTRQDASRSWGAQTPLGGAEELCNYRGQWPKLTSSLFPSCRFMSTPLLTLLLNSHAQTSRCTLLESLLLQWFQPAKGHYELPCVYESCDTNTVQPLHSQSDQLFLIRASCPLLLLSTTYAV